MPFFLTVSSTSILKSRGPLLCYLALLATRWESLIKLWKLGSQTFDLRASWAIKTNPSGLSAHNNKKIPESTVKTAAKALSLSPSMTLLELNSSKHMRLKPTTSRTMYNISDTSDSHSIPAE